MLQGIKITFNFCNVNFFKRLKFYIFNLYKLIPQLYFFIYYKVVCIICQGDRIHFGEEVYITHYYLLNIN